MPDPMPLDEAPELHAASRLRARLRFQALYRAMLLSALTTVGVVLLNLILDRRAAQAAPPFLEQFEQTDPVPERLPVFDPAEVSPEELLPPPAEPFAEPDITLSA